LTTHHKITRNARHPMDDIVRPYQNSLVRIWKRPKLSGACGTTLANRRIKVRAKAAAEAEVEARKPEMPVHIGDHLQRQIGHALEQGEVEVAGWPIRARSSIRMAK